MSAPIILLAEHIASAINTAQSAGTLGALSFEAQHSYPTWDDDYKDLKSLAVDVVYVSSGGDLFELDSAYSMDTEAAFDIAVRYRFNSTTERGADGRVKTAAVNTLVTLVEVLHTLLANARNTSIELASGVTANWVDATIRTYCDYGRLRQGNFLGCVRLRFNVSKGLS